MAHFSDTVSLGKGIRHNLVRVTAAHACTFESHTVECDSTSGAFAVTLPLLADAYQVVDTDEGKGSEIEVILAVDGGDVTLVEHTDDGGATVATLDDAGDTVRVVATSTTTWRVVKPAAADTADLAAGALSADAAGRAIMASSYFNEATVDDKFAAGSIDADRIKSNTITETQLSLSTTMTIALPFTLGNRSGVNSDGVMVGALTHTAVGDCTQEDNSGGTFVDETADANSAGAGDVAIPDPFDTSDALYIGYESAPFCAVIIDVGTAGAGDDEVGETIWEYSQGGGVWATLETGHELIDDSAALSTGTDTYVVSFVPPSDWAVQAVDGGTAMYFVRLRATADDVYNTTQPTITQIWVVPTDVGQGLAVPVTGTITAVDLQALTASATNNDTELLLVNVTQGTHVQLTWTGGDVMDRITGLSLAVTKGDGLVLVVINEDGTTEFASGQAIVQIDM